MSNVAYADFGANASSRSARMENQKQGHFALFRSLLSSGWADDTAKLALWVRLLGMAQYKPRRIEFGGVDWDLDTGQLVTKPRLLARKLRDAKGNEKTPKQVRDMLEFFSSEGMLTFSGNRHGTVITISNYTDYQLDVEVTNKLNNYKGSTQYEVTKQVNDFEVTKQVTNQVTNKPSHDVAFSDGQVTKQVTKQVKQSKKLLEQEYITSNDVGEFSDENNPPQPVRKSQSKKESVPYQAMIDAYHEILPEMARITVLRDARKSKMRTFWQRANKEYQTQHQKSFTLENWKGYLGYIAEHCRWMMEESPNGKGGYWRAKNLDYLITDQCYVSVKEDRANDRKNNR
ncbi:replication protein [Xenorhabdus sp. XENO-7]|uniref:Replication protein n=1 Tax=Xenorhabdus aichiensis TaxID=3025874 RepID=A0ABT5MCF2_9GAMM|nr:replication protein [Xenorhabdus aichiensis]MDC9623951.1 replication protein [Xenorhabdus aichiensis]